MSLRLTALFPPSLRRFGSVLVTAVVLVRPAPGQSTQTVSTAAGSNVSIQVTNVYNGIPARGYLPLRVSIANTSNNDGHWEVVTQATGVGGTSDRHFGAQATCLVPAHQTQVFEVLAPLPTTDPGTPLPHVSVHVTGPGVTNGDVQFNANLQDPPPSALTRMVAVNPTPTTTTRGRVGTTTVISLSSDGSNTRTSTTIQSDGTTITETIVTRADGSSTTTTTMRNPAGAIMSNRSTVSPAPRGGTSGARGTSPAGTSPNTYTGATIISAGGPTIITTASSTSFASSVMRNSDGSTTKTTTTSQADGTTRTENVTTFPDGSTSTNFTVKDAIGRTLQSGGTSGGRTQSQGSGPTPSAPPINPPASARPPGVTYTSPEQLKMEQIIIPNLNIDIPTPLDQVVATLTVLSRKYDPDGKGLSFMVYPPANGGQMPKVVIPASANVSLARLIDAACRAAGYGYYIDKGIVALSQGAATAMSSGGFERRTFPLSTEMFNRLVAASKSAAVATSAANSSANGANDQALLELLVKTGIDFPAGTRLAYADGFLYVLNTPRNLEALNTFLQMYLGAQPGPATSPTPTPSLIRTPSTSTKPEPPTPVSTSPAVQNWNGDFTFIGTNGLNLGQGAANVGRDEGIDWANSGLLEKTTPQAGDTAKTTIVTDPVTGQVVRTTILKHGDGSTTTISATPVKVGFNVETVVADARGVRKSTTTEILLSPQFIQQAIPVEFSQAKANAPLSAVDALITSMGKVELAPLPTVIKQSAPKRGAESVVAAPIRNAPTRAIANVKNTAFYKAPGLSPYLWAGPAGAVNTATSTSPAATPAPASSVPATSTTNSRPNPGTGVNIGIPAILGSPQSGSIQINNGTITISGNGIIQGNVTIGGGAVTLSSGAIYVNPTANAGTQSLVKSGPSTLTLSGSGPTNVFAAAAPPPPPPAPPPVPIGGRSGVITSSSSVTFSSTPVRGVRGGYQPVRRDAGAAIFVGISASLSQSMGDKIKNYFNTTCARPIQQTTLDTNPDTTQMSSDWRAYLGFDLIFLTGTDWVAAPAGVRTALAYWVAAGGELRLVANSDGGLNLPVRQGEHYGAGALELYTEDELNNYNFTLEHTDSKDRYLFNLEYKPSMLAAVAVDTGEIPAGMERRDFTVSQFILMRYIGTDSSVFAGNLAAANPRVETDLTGFFARAGADFPTGASLKYSLIDDKVTITNTKTNLDVIARLLTNYGAPDGVVVGTGPALPANPPVATVAPAAPGTTATAKTPVDVKRYADEVPHIGNHYMLVATVIICFGFLVGPLNLFWFCKGSRRPHLLWVTPLLAIAASAAIVAFILLAEGIGGRGIYYRITQLVPDGKVAVESEVESSVTGLLTHRDFVLLQPAWLLDFKSSKTDQEWDRGDFMQSGGHYQGDWFVSRREQTVVARSVVPSRAELHVAAGAEGKPPVMTSMWNDWMQNLYYMDSDSHYWKLDKISDGKPTSMLAATKEEFDAAWEENVHSAPVSFAAYLRKLTPRPGTFFALGNGNTSYLEPEYTGLRWSRFRHIITGPVVQ